MFFIFEKNPRMKVFGFDIPEVAGFLLFLTLLCMIFILPALPPDWQLRTSRVLYTIIYFSAVLSLDHRSKPILVISMVALCAEWLAGIFDFWIITTISKSVNIIFFLFIVFILIHQVATSRVVNLRVILGSVIGYLLVGLIYSILVAFIMQQDPLAFNVTAANGPTGKPFLHFSESFYFSFITFATVGFGDILPIKPYTRSIAVLIGISGQLYIAIIIALLVGKFSAGHHVKHDKLKS